MCHTSAGDAALRYAADVVSLHRRLGYRGLTRLPDGTLLHRAQRGDGLTTIAARTRDLPHRYLVALQGFRLAQYLQLGWVCEDVVYSSALFCEPVHGIGADDVHIVTVRGDGSILGYLSLATSGDESPADLADPDRPRFPVERAHGVNVFEQVPGLPDVLTDQVREVKRFVHSRSLSDKQQRLRVTLELLFALGQVLTVISPRVVTLIGDLEENVALRHMLLTGLDVQLIEGTTPQLGARDLMHHAYSARDVVKPFVAHLPDADGVAERAELLREALDSPDLFDATTHLGSRVCGGVTRIAA